MNTTVEVELVEGGVRPQIVESPVFSGTVFRIAPQGPRPAADMAVLYSSNSHDGADVYGRTDAEGRYRFYNLPLGPGYVLPACTQAAIRPPNYRAVTVSVHVAGDTIVDVNCP